MFNNFDSTSKDARLLYDIFRYGYGVKSLEGFKITELINWLLDNNHDLRNDDEIKHQRKSHRVIVKRSYIQRRLDYLIRNDCIMQTGSVDSEKNGEKTPLYQFTPFLIYGLPKFFQNNTIDNYNVIMQKHKDLIKKEMRFLLANVYSVEHKYFLILIEKLYQNATFEDFIILCSIFAAPFYRVEISFFFFPWIYNGILNFDKHNYFRYPNYKDFVNSLINNKETILDVFWNLHGEERSLILFELKLQIERFYYRKFNTSEFEVQRMKPNHSINKVVIQIACKECKSSFPLLIPIEELINKHFGRKRAYDYYPCNKCSLKDDSNSENQNFTCSILDDQYDIQIHENM
jgi:hypothetical protein